MLFRHACAFGVGQHRSGRSPVARQCKGCFLLLGLVGLPASAAEVHGVMLRFEPLPHKDTLGYWVRPDDWASWDFEVERPGRFEVELHHPDALLAVVEVRP